MEIDLWIPCPDVTTQLRFLSCSRRTTCSHELEATYPNWFVVASCPACGTVPQGRELAVFVRNEVEVRELRFSDCQGSVTLSRDT
jgi:hypothetical protein